MRSGSKRDVYACVKCSGWIAHGDLFCKHCGRQFNTEDIDFMSAAVTKASTLSAPDNSAFKECLKCPGCSTLVTNEDNYCKKCGWYFDDEVREFMTSSDGDKSASKSGFFKGALIVFLIGACFAIVGLL